MARKRSPNYPNLSLPEAIEKIEQAYPKAHRAKTDKAAMASLFGYASLHGSSLTMLGSLLRYGLLEGTKSEMSISDDGETISIEPITSKLRLEAIQRCMRRPKVFDETLAHFEDRLPADELLKPYLIRKGFSMVAVENVIRSLRETVEFVGEEEEAYNKTRAQDIFGVFKPIGQKMPTDEKLEVPTMTQDSLTLEEGQVVLQYPKKLSPSSVEYLETWLQLQIKMAKEFAKKNQPNDGR